MIAEYRVKSKVALLESIIEKIGLSDGDLIDISEQNGGVLIMPVATIPKKYTTMVDGVQKEFSTREEYREILKGIYGSLDILKDTHTPDGKAKRKFATKEEYHSFIEETFGSIDDPTFVEPPEIEYESFREPII